MPTLPFADRLEAGRFLAEELTDHKVPPDAIVLALARGGVPVGAEVARRLGLSLDVLVVRKLGVPGQQEVAMGALLNGSKELLDRSLIESLEIEPEAIAEAVRKERAELLRRENLYRAGLPPLNVEGRTVLLVDDGLATGCTMLAAARHIRKQNPAILLMAVPVTSVGGSRRMRGEVDGQVFVAAPEPFIAVSYWYRNFPQVTDAEVRQLLGEHRRR